MEEWQAKGVIDWKKNQEIKREREETQLAFELTRAEAIKDKVDLKREQAQNEVVAGISDFEKRLGRMKREVECQDMQKREKLRKWEDFMGGDLLQKKGLSEYSKKERERRRRKMIVDQAKMQNELESIRREDEIIEKMLRESRQEEELGYELWRTRQCKSVIIENRKLREARYQKRRDLDREITVIREEEALKTEVYNKNKRFNVEKGRSRHLQIFKKQQKRDQHNETCLTFLNSIFDIANEAFKHEQQKDTDEIDSRNWREWVQLFVSLKPISVSAIPENAETSIVPYFESEEIAEANENLNKTEFRDYLNGERQWRGEILTSNMPNLEEIFQKSEGEVKGKKGGGGGSAEDKINIEENEIPLEAPKNYNLGCSIQRIIDLNFAEEEIVQEPQVPFHLPLKLSILGHSFAGKMTQAILLAKKYNLEMIELAMLVKEALEAAPSSSFAKQIQIEDEAERAKHANEKEKEEYHPLESNRTFRSSQGDQTQNREEGSVAFASVQNLPNPQTDDIPQTQDIDEQQPQQESELMIYGAQIRELLEEGKEISDHLYVNLVVLKLREKLGYKSREQVRQELEKEVEIELNEEMLQDEVHQIYDGSEDTDTYKKILSKTEPNGYILLDFPSSLNQAKLLEEALSGYVPKEDKKPSEKEMLKKSASEIVEPTPIEPEPERLVESGLDSILWLDVSTQESIRRAVGRRVNPKTGQIYHVDDNPPPTNRHNLIENLESLNDEDHSEPLLVDKHIAFDANSHALQKWLKRFGIEHNPAKPSSKIEYNILQTIEANDTSDNIFSKIETVIDMILNNKLLERAQFKTEQRQIQEVRISEAKEREAEVEREKQREEELRRKEEEEEAEAEREAAESPKVDAKSPTPKTPKGKTREAKGAAKKEEGKKEKEEGKKEEGKKEEGKKEEGKKEDGKEEEKEKEDEKKEEIKNVDHSKAVVDDDYKGTQICGLCGMCFFIRNLAGAVEGD